MGDVNRYTSSRFGMIGSTDGNYVEFSDYEQLKAQLAQAREQADYHRNLIELQGDEIKRQAAELQQAREQVAASLPDDFRKYVPRLSEWPKSAKWWCFDYAGCSYFYSHGPDRNDYKWEKDYGISASVIIPAEYWAQWTESRISREVAEVMHIKAENQQLRARLAGAMEWVPVADADLKYNENILVLHEDGKWNDCEYRGGGFCKFHDGEEVFNVTHICRIKPITPPPSNPAEREP